MASPTKRHALAPLDANAHVPSPLSSKRSMTTAKLSGGALLSAASAASANGSTSPSTKKRPFLQHSRAAQEQQRTPKKACVAAAGPRLDHRSSVSPSPSSVFDLSAAAAATAGDTSQTTNLTEPDVDATPRPAHTRTAPPRTTPTREQSRQRAEILKLRLGLARYKLRTGQVDVPLERLRVVPTPRTTSQSTIHSLSQGLSLSFTQSQQSQGSNRSRSRTPLPNSPRPLAQAAGDWIRQQQLRQQQQQQQQPQRWTTRGRPRDLDYHGDDTSSDEEDFRLPVQPRVARPVSNSSSNDSNSSNSSNSSSKTVVPRASQQSLNLDDVDRIEDSDGAQEGDGAEEEKEVDEHEAADEEGRQNGLPQMPPPPPDTSATAAAATAAAAVAAMTAAAAATTTTAGAPRENHQADNLPDHDERLESSALQGGAVHGLLRLSRA